MKNTVYDIITDRIVAKLEEGTVPWRRPWTGKNGTTLPRNFTSDREYRGVNPFILNCQGYRSPFWLTFNQAKTKGGTVRKGEKGCPVVFWKTDVVEDSQTGEDRKRFLLRYYTVFNVAQCDGLTVPELDDDADDRDPIDPIEAAEGVVDGMPKAPPIKDGRNQAYYSPVEDIVGIPDRQCFESAERYYATLFHELTHSTRHASRLDRGKRDKPNAFGSHAYSKEELVAEMGAAFLCGSCGIFEPQVDQSAAYIASWLKALKNDSKMVVMAAAQAQKAADFILSNREETP